MLSQQNRIRPTLFIFVGDFNTTLHNFEKWGGYIVREDTKENMEHLQSIYDLMDIFPISGHYTWSNKRQGSGHITTRLDRFLIRSKS
jgi:hypothetical protein